MSLNYEQTAFDDQTVWLRDEEGRKVGIRDSVTAIDEYGQHRRDSSIEIVEQHCDSEAVQNFDTGTTTFAIEGGYKIVFTGSEVECILDES